MAIKIRYNYQTLLLFFLWISGVAKSFFVTYIAEIDIVLMALVLAVLDILVVGFTNWKQPSKDYFLGLLIVLALFLYINLSLTYSLSDNYRFTKAINFIPNIVFFLYALTLKKINLKLFTRLYLVVLIPLAAFFIYMKSILFVQDTSATRTFMDLRQNYLAIGLHLAILFFILLYRKSSLWLKILVFFLLFASSARGALLFAVITYFLFYGRQWLRFKVKKRNAYISLATLATLGILLFVFWNKVATLAANAIYRLEVLLSGQGSSTSNRVAMMEYAFNEPFKNPLTFFFGHGIGSFGTAYAVKDERLYPHNIILELFFELGFLGVLLISILLALVFIKVLKGKKLWLVLFFFCLLNAMKSSNLTDLWVLFSIIGISLNQNRITLTDR